MTDVGAGASALLVLTHSGTSRTLRTAAGAGTIRINRRSVRKVCDAVRSGRERASAPKFPARVIGLDRIPEFHEIKRATEESVENLSDSWIEFGKNHYDYRERQ